MSKKNNHRTVYLESKDEGEKKFEGNVKEAVKDAYKTIDSKRRSLLIDPGFEIIREVSLGDLGLALNKTRRKVFVVILDGTATRTIIKICEEKGILHLAAKNFAAVETNLDLISL